MIGARIGRKEKERVAMDYDVTDMNLADKGANRIGWASVSMPVLNQIFERFRKEKPLAGLRLAACLHVTTETGRLVEVLMAGGAQVALCASNPLSTQDDAASRLAQEGASVFARKGEDRDTYYRHIHAVLDTKPQITMDDGADLVSILHTERKELLEHVLGGTEETTTGVVRLRSLAQSKLLRYPIIAVNDADTKHLFDNRYGTGQSTIDGILRATNRLLAGATFVVVGYGWCGRGVSARAKGMNANVVICEVNPVRALEATMDGFRVMPMREAAKIGDFFCTVTGDIHVIDLPHFELMKDGAIVANSGHFNVELNLDALAKVSKKRRQVRDFLEEFTLPSGKRIYVLGEGRLINLAAAEGHPSSVMDMSFANQSLCAEYMFKQHQTLQPTVYPVPTEIDQQIARLKLKAMGMEIDVLSAEQEKYLSAWEMGT